MTSEAIKLAGCVITDDDHRVLLLHRTDHNQWQLPGGRIRLGDPMLGKIEETPEDAARREAYDELGLIAGSLTWLGRGNFRQGIAAYECEWFRVNEFQRAPLLEQPDIYDDFQYHNLLRRGMGRLAMSPNVVRLIDAIEGGKVLL